MNARHKAHDGHVGDPGEPVEGWVTLETPQGASRIK